MTCLRDFTNQLKNRVLTQNENKHSGSDDQHQRGSGGIPLTRKLCYAVGGVPYQITAVAIGVSLQIFLLDVVQMEAYYVSLILFVSRAWDAVTDPLVGYLVSRSKRTPVGKLVPWLLLSSPLAVLSYLLLWFEPGGAVSQPLSVLWFLTVTCLFETLMSFSRRSCALGWCHVFPSSSVPSATTSRTSRSTCSWGEIRGTETRPRPTVRPPGLRSHFISTPESGLTSVSPSLRLCPGMSVEMVAMLLASVIQGQVVAVYNTEKQEVCQQLDEANETPQSSATPPTASLQGTRKAFLTSGLVVGALFFLCSLVLVFGVKEQPAPVRSDDKAQPSYLTSLKMLIRHIPYQRLVLGFVFSALAFQMSWSNFALFCSHAAGLGAQFQYLLLALLTSASVAVPLWQAVLLRVGKKTTLFIGLSFFIPAVTIIACAPSNLPLFVIMCILMGFSVATVFLLPWSMLPDVLDDFAVKHPSCTDLEPLFFSCYAFCSKLAGGLSVGISTMILQFVGYRAGACNHGDGVVTALMVLFAPVPIALLLIGMVFFCSYPIDERRLQTADLQPEATSSSDARENAEQLHPGVISTSQNNTKTDTSHKSNSSPCCYSQDGSCLVKSSAPSDVLSPPAEYSRCNSVVQSNAHRQHHKQRPRNQKHSGKMRLSRNIPENDSGSFSSGTNVRSKVSWV
ncbi:LOW QUALITY PROTEIN: sodium-dependent lysophosphatidylcholine symporter 1-B-like [Hippoglossus stenolepis]|uniref:LOW QUALITY PROTEIN: sodium-dependent lysophosphatidylcholine symporter 1-B-like n=1 Tax=Hippoglossus stenolepis TaxID=195615 RepID=UPI001FAED212|nr:LOW QUALITY PROTEIN: sodium-dependent lysophosphatidylcholine symporter 1-B-like [Hippoglossus stenolepis]